MFFIMVTKEVGAGFYITLQFYIKYKIYFLYFIVTITLMDWL